MNTSARLSFLNARTALAPATSPGIGSTFQPAWLRHDRVASSILRSVGGGEAFAQRTSRHGRRDTRGDDPTNRQTQRSNRAHGPHRTPSGQPRRDPERAALARAHASEHAVASGGQHDVAIALGGPQGRARRSCGPIGRDRAVAAVSVEGIEPPRRLPSQNPCQALDDEGSRMAILPIERLTGFAGRDYGIAGAHLGEERRRARRLASMVTHLKKRGRAMGIENRQLGLLRVADQQNRRRAKVDTKADRTVVGVVTARRRPGGGDQRRHRVRRAARQGHGRVLRFHDVGGHSELRGRTVSVGHLRFAPVAAIVDVTENLERPQDSLRSADVVAAGRKA